MLRLATFALLLAGLATVATAESVYKWTDARGQVHYTDLPPTDPGARMIEVIERDVVETSDTAPGNETGQPSPAAGNPPPPAEEPAPSAAAAVQRDLAQARAAQCKQAQDRYKTYITSQRLFRETPDGKREYLTDSELTAARVAAKQAVSDYCD